MKVTTQCDTDTTFEFSLNFLASALLIKSKCWNKHLFVNQAPGPWKLDLVRQINFPSRCHNRCCKSPHCSLWCWHWGSRLTKHRRRAITASASKVLMRVCVCTVCCPVFNAYLGLIEDRKLRKHLPAEDTLPVLTSTRSYFRTRTCWIHWGLREKNVVT